MESAIRGIRYRSSCHLPVGKILLTHPIIPAPAGIGYPPPHSLIKVFHVSVVVQKRPVEA